MSTLLSVFGGSGYRYKFSLFTFDNIHGVEDAFPAEGAVFLFVRRFFNALRQRFDYELLHCDATDDLSALSVGGMAKRIAPLLKANCVGVLCESAPDVREAVVKDVVQRNFG